MIDYYMPIKHLVLPGGGTACMCLVGALQKLHDADIWNIDDIKAIYSVSAGSIIAVLIALKFNWETIVDYLVKRPWSDVYNVNLANIFDIFMKKGFYGADFFVTFFKPFFDSKDIDMNITMSELYAMTGVDIHFCTTELSSFTFTSISHETHPNVEVLTAVQMSAACPLIISPVFSGGKCYIDGGLLCNYPMAMCLKRYPDKSEVLGIGNQTKYTRKDVTEGSSLLEFIETLLYSMVSNLANRIKDDGNIENIPVYVSIPIPNVTVTSIQNTFSDMNLRNELLETGRDRATAFLEARANTDDEDTGDVSTSDHIEDELLSQGIV
jgi:predicted acylesterase/phospholipase RssA